MTGQALHHVDHCCAVCESDCDTVTALRQRVRDLERDRLRLGFMLATFEVALRVPEGSASDWFPKGRVA